MASNNSMVTLRTRMKRLWVSALAFVTGLACTVFGVDFGAPTPMCYEAPAYTPTPEITCYEPLIPVDPHVKAMSKVPRPESYKTPVIECYIVSPDSLITPTPTPESRDVLRARLLAEGRFPADVAREL